MMTASTIINEDVSISNFHFYFGPSQPFLSPIQCTRKRIGAYIRVCVYVYVFFSFSSRKYNFLYRDKYLERYL